SAGDSFEFADDHYPRGRQYWDSGALRNGRPGVEGRSVAAGKSSHALWTGLGKVAAVLHWTNSGAQVQPATDAGDSARTQSEWQKFKRNGHQAGRCAEGLSRL